MLRWVFLTFLLIPVPHSNTLAEEAGEPSLAGLMAQMQVYTHKLDLSIQAGNAELAGFYLHELEEVTEEVIENIPDYGGFAVGELTAAMLVASIEAVESATSNELADEAMSALVNSCNNCHAATKHNFIRIERTSNNPFNQDFGPL